MNAESDNRKALTVFVSAYRGFSMRYLVYSGVLEELANRGLHIVLFVKDGDVPYYRQKLSGQTRDVEPVLSERTMRCLKGNRLQRLFVLTRKLMSGGRGEDRNTTDAVLAQQYGQEMRRGWLHAQTWEYYAARILAAAGTRVRRIRQGLVAVEAALFSGRFYDEYFAKYHPRLLVVSSLGSMIDPYIMRAAKRWGCTIVSVIYNWDNPTTKDYRGCVPNAVIVWNESMKHEVNVFHDIPIERIYVGGIAHWDFYFDGAFQPGPREAFTERYGLNENRRTVFYATSSSRMFPWTFDVIEQLLNTIQSNRLSSPSQLLVRLHPAYLARKRETGEQKVQEYTSRMRRLESKYRGLVSFALPAMNLLEDDLEMPSEDMHELARCLYHSDVVLTEYSTVMIEAAIFDKPVVNVGLHSFRGLNVPASTVEQLTHIRQILRFGASRNAHTFDELVEYVDCYLRNPSTDQENRKSLVDHLVTTQRGTARKHVADLLFQVANTAPGNRL